jgi:two-component system nitrogen regulation response regulator GlnG
MQMPAGNILVADDDAAIRTVLNQALSRAGYEVRSTSNAATLWRWVSQGEGDLVITDVVMPDENAFELIPRIKKLRPELPIIVMSAQNTFMTAIRASERGAYEYLPKPFDLKELIGIVGRALSEPKDRPRQAAKPDEIDSSIPLVGRSPAMQEIYRLLARLMQTDLTVMITGESGTGKELVARALHDYGKRRSGPFVAINMAAIPRDLIESELFGHEKGAFTGANTRSPAASNRRKVARCSSTRSATCRWRRRRGCCACCNRANTRRSAGARRSRPTCASLPPPTRICGS